MQAAPRTLASIFVLLLAAYAAHSPAPAAVAKKGKAGARRRSTAAKKRPSLPLVDPTDGDNVDGEDLTVRRAAVEAMGRFNGSVVVVNPQTGRILSVVNQRLALRSGFIPCSTVKLVTSLAALNEGIVDRYTQIYIGRRVSFNLTSAIAHSNNQYFARLGTRLGFDRVHKYAEMLGLGEKAGWEIPGEQPGELVEKAPVNGGVGLMCSFGEGVSLTPLELAALLSAISNGGTLYYLQYPRTEEDLKNFEPRVKRRLDLSQAIYDLKVGMRAAVEFGTARRAAYSEQEPVLGKTGTCTDFRSANHMGWFGSFNDVGRNKLVVVVMLTGNHSVNGPVAAGVAGAIYRSLSDLRFFATNTPPPLLSTQSCCVR